MQNPIENGCTNEGVVQMLQLIKELLKREWSFTLTDSDGTDRYHLELILGNQILYVYNSNDARSVLKEIREHW